MPDDIHGPELFEVEIRPGAERTDRHDDFPPPASLTCRTSRGESPYDGGNVTTKGGLRHAHGLGTP